MHMFLTSTCTCVQAFNGCTMRIKKNILEFQGLQKIQKYACTSFPK